MKKIQVKRTRKVGEVRGGLISDILLWTPSNGRTKAGRPATNYIQQFCADTAYSLEDLPGTIETGRDRGSARYDDDDDLEYSDYGPHLYCYSPNVPADLSFWYFISKTGVHIESRTESLRALVWVTGVDCSKSVNQDRVQVLSCSNISFLTCCWDRTYKLIHSETDV